MVHYHILEWLEEIIKTDFCPIPWVCDLVGLGGAWTLYFLLFFYNGNID